MPQVTEIVANGQVIVRDMTEAELAEYAELRARPAPVPQEVSLFQARAALIIYGAQIGRPNLREEVDALVSNLPTGAPNMTAIEAMVIQEAWANAQVIRRNSPALNLIFPALGLTLPEQLDALFVIAAGIIA
jgi:hypothetical protein